VIKEWDRTDRLSEIRVPTLILSGRYVEEPELYLQTVQAFLSRVDNPSDLNVS
jgi:hypothetical protein